MVFSMPRSLTKSIREPMMPSASLEMMMIRRRVPEVSADLDVICLAGRADLPFASLRTGRRRALAARQSIADQTNIVAARVRMIRLAPDSVTEDRLAEAGALAACWEGGPRIRTRHRACSTTRNETRALRPTSDFRASLGRRIRKTGVRFHFSDRLRVPGTDGVVKSRPCTLPFQ